MTAWLLLATVGLLLANAFFVAVEFALIAARRTKIQHLAVEGNARARLALSSIHELSFMLAGAQLGITMASLGLGAISEPAVARLIESALHETTDLSTAASHSIAFAIALSIVVFLHMVIGEMAPKNVAIAVPEGSALWLALPARIYANIFRPFIHLLNVIANQTLRLVKVEPQDELITVHTAGEIGVMVGESAKEGLIGEWERRLLSGAVVLGDLDAAAAMVPRTELTAAPTSAIVREIENLIVTSGHSRIPLYENDIDHMLGFVHAKDLLKVGLEGRERPVPRQMIRPMLVVPESRKLQDLLHEMRNERRHFALVVDEHGGTAGVATIENLVEELVGEIRDEYDLTELGIERLGDGRFLVPGTLRVDQAADRLEMGLPEGEYETIAGYIMDRLGRVPKRGDVVSFEGWKMHVRSMQRRRVVQVLIERI